MKRLFGFARILGLVCLTYSWAIPPAFAQQAAIPKPGEWTVRVEATSGTKVADAARKSLVVERGGKEQVRLTGFDFSLGASGLPATAALGIGDITGDSTPELVVIEKTSSRECCTRLRIFELGETLVSYPPLNLGTFSPVRFENTDALPGFELPGVDLTFAGWGSRDLLRPAFRVVYQPKSGKWRLWRPKEKGQREVPKELISAIKQKLSAVDPSHPAQDLPEILTSSVVGYIYEGRAKEARTLLDAVWPEDRKGKGAYVSAIRERMLLAPFAEDLKAELEILAGK